MKQHTFPDPDKEGYEIVIPNEVKKDIIIEYLRTTYYWSIALACFIIGFLVRSVL
jgi:hypothetical protein